VSVSYADAQFLEPGGQTAGIAVWIDQFIGRGSQQQRWRAIGFGRGKAAENLQAYQDGGIPVLPAD